MSGFTALTYLAFDNRRGPGRSCALIVNAFATAGVRARLYTPRSRRAMDPSVELVEVVPAAARGLPWRLIREVGAWLLARRFRTALKRADPASTVAYFWPGAPLKLVRFAKARGFLTVREMINSPCETAKSILDDAYLASGAKPRHRISRRVARTETEELKLYDLVFASNPEVSTALRGLGVRPGAIADTSFGWASEDFRVVPSDAARPLRFLFLGTVEVRKGILDLLEAWWLAGIEGELVLAGHVEPLVAQRLKALASPSIRALGFVQDVPSLLAECDVFVFPTLEEGGPQVTYEAGAAGLAIVTTPMGAARLVQDGETGLVVAPRDPAGMARALRRLADDPALRHRLGATARRETDRYSYARVGRQRAERLRDALLERAG